MGLTVRDEVRSKIRTYAWVSNRRGDEINVGERFEVTVAVRNEAQLSDNIVCTSLRMHFKESPWASPVDSVGNLVALMEDGSTAPLEPGASFEFVRQFEATAQDVPGPFENKVNWNFGSSNNDKPDEWINYQLFFDVDSSALLGGIASSRRLRVEIEKQLFHCSNPTVVHDHEYWSEYCLVPIQDSGGSHLCGYPIPH